MSKMINCRLITLCSCGLLALSAIAPNQTLMAQSLPEFSAYYKARTNGVSGDAERHLVHQGEGRYRLTSSLTARVLGLKIGAIEQVSEFLWTAQGIESLRYDYRLSGVRDDEESIRFDQDAGIAVSAEEDQSWTIELKGEVLDPVNYQQALALVVAENPDAGEYSLQLIDGPGIEVHRFRNSGKEIVDTPLGKLRCHKLERIREAGSGRSTTIWLAADWHNLLARIEQRNPSGRRIELNLTRAQVAGQSVMPLAAEAGRAADLR